MQRFQYRIVNLGAFGTAERMVYASAHLGEHGWELATVYDKASNWFAGLDKGVA